MKNKLLVGFYLLLFVSFIDFQGADANDCPRLKFAKSYSTHLSTSPISVLSTTELQPGFITIKRLSSDQYLATSPKITYLVTENCGKVSYENSTFNPNLKYSDGSFIDTTVALTCDGFLNRRKVVKGSCVITFSDPTGVTIFEDVTSFSWRPLKN